MVSLLPRWSCWSSHATPEFGLRDPLAESRLAAPIAETGREALDGSLAWAGVDPRSLGIPYQTQAAVSGDLPFSGITANELENDRAAEQTLLEFLNQERANAGLSSLQADAASG